MVDFQPVDIICDLILGPNLWDAMHTDDTQLSTMGHRCAWGIPVAWSMLSYIREEGVTGVEARDRLRVRLATADRGLFMLSGSPSFHPGTWPDRGLF